MAEDPPVTMHTHQPDPQQAASQPEMSALHAAFMLQGELLKSGYKDAALHIAELLSRQGLRFPIPQEEHKKAHVADNLYYVPPVQVKPLIPTSPKIVEEPQGVKPPEVPNNPEKLAIFPS